VSPSPERIEGTGLAQELRMSERREHGLRAEREEAA
jgi:hypothetical protein